MCLLWLFLWFVLALAVTVVAMELWKRSHEKDLSGDVVLVTGGASGIGRELALAFAQSGCDLVLWDINGAGLKTVAAEVTAAGAKRVMTREVNVTDVKAVNNAASKAIAEMGRVDILVNNAGIALGFSFLESTVESVEKTIKINLISNFTTIRAFLPGMIERKHGHILATASVAGHLGLSHMGDYCASKHGVVGMMESLRHEINALGFEGVYATALCPSFTKSNLHPTVQNQTLPGWPDLEEASVVAQRALKAVRRNEPMVVVPLYFWGAIVLKSLLPYAIFKALHNMLNLEAMFGPELARATKKTI